MSAVFSVLSQPAEFIFIFFNDFIQSAHWTNLFHADFASANNFCVTWLIEQSLTSIVELTVYYRSVKEKK